jgi:ATP-dependent Clp protease ATP-binding subunit ClpC
MATASALHTRMLRGRERRGNTSRELAGRLALQLHLIKEGIRDAIEAAPIEVALQVEPVFEKPAEHHATRQWCGQLLDMYRGWANNRHMQLSELAADQMRQPRLLISGFGAHRVLAQEVGLHVLEADEDKGPRRATARVNIAVAPLGDIPVEKQERLLAEAFEASPRTGAIVRRYRSTPSPLVRNMNGSWRSGRLDAVLRGDFDLIAASQS